MNLLNEKDKCCGCTACVSVCPKKDDIFEKSALTMSADEEGFLYPVLNKNNCISCHQCESVCFYRNGYKQQEDYLEEHIDVYALRHNDNEVRERSQSGGVFAALARHVIEAGGIVYGAGFNSDFSVSHKRVTDLNSLQELSGSKYVQSNLKGIYPLVRKDLLENKVVLFSGTGCQIAGLASFLRYKKYNNLILADIICYGSPSPKVWQDFIDFYQKKYNSKLSAVKFRDKAFGWHTCRTTLEFINGKKVTTDFWTHLWGSNNILRPSCHNCQFTNLKRPSDITMGDCWGIDSKMPDFDDNKGTSLAIVNTERGRELFNFVKDKFQLREISIQEYLQPRLKEPAKAAADRSVFWHNYQNMPFEKVLELYAGYSFSFRVKEQLKKIPLLDCIYQSIKNK